MKIIIPSYKRPNTCITPHYLKNAIVLVNESEEDLYREAIPNELMVMPDSLGGNMARVRNFILNNANDDVVMLDDDISYFGFYEHAELQKMPAEAIEERFENFFEMAKDCGTVLWGVNLLADKMAYRQYSPLSLSSVILGPCMGITKECPIRFDETLGLKEDYDFSLQVLNRYRRVLRFNKYHYLAKHKDMSGGCSAYRTKLREAQQMALFVKKWGSAIVKWKAGDINPQVNCPIKGI